MSDPVTNAEIEDVLSSIRRLVSTDEREKPAAPKAVPDEQDKLVLTPSQRVDEAPEEDGAPEVAEADHAPVEAAFLAQYAVDPPPESDEQEGDTEPSEPETSQGPSDDGDAPQPEFKHHDEEHFFKASAIETGRGQNAAAGDEEIAHDVAEPTEATDQDADAPSDQAADGEPQEASETPDSSPDLQARIASVEAALAGRDDEWEPDGDDDDPYAGDQVTTLEWEDHAADESAPEVPAQTAESTPFDAAQDEGFEPDATNLAGGFTPSATEQDDHLDAPEGETPEEATGEDDDWQLQGDVLDEDALRDMVSEIVRQELQGALGERITRNVRKLVRREIHRALASQDFE